jgi:hypothetical protein
MQDGINIHPHMYSPTHVLAWLGALHDVVEEHLHVLFVHVDSDIVGTS